MLKWWVSVINRATQTFSLRLVRLLSMHVSLWVHIRCFQNVATAHHVWVIAAIQIGRWICICSLVEWVGRGHCAFWHMVLVQSWHRVSKSRILSHLLALQKRPDHWVALRWGVLAQSLIQDRNWPVVNALIVLLGLAKRKLRLLHRYHI